MWFKATWIETIKYLKKLEMELKHKYEKFITLGLFSET